MDIIKRERYVNLAIRAEKHELIQHNEPLVLKTCFFKEMNELIVRMENTLISPLCIVELEMELEITSVNIRLIDWNVLQIWYLIWKLLNVLVNVVIPLLKLNHRFLTLTLFEGDLNIMLTLSVKKYWSWAQRNSHIDQ